MIPTQTRWEILNTHYESSKPDLRRPDNKSELKLRISAQNLFPSCGRTRQFGPILTLNLPCPSPVAPAGALCCSNARGMPIRSPWLRGRPPSYIFNAPLATTSCSLFKKPSRDITNLCVHQKPGNEPLLAPSLPSRSVLPWRPCEGCGQPP